MVLFNYAIREITAKLVYYGPGLGGKTTNLQWIHEKLDPGSRGKLLSLATDGDRTLFFDFLPIEMGNIGGYNVRFQLYTVPGQVHYNATRKLVLKGVDAVAFVADSQITMLERNKESFENLVENLAENGYEISKIPVVIQLNKRDLPNIASPAELVSSMGVQGYPFLEAVAYRGEGVFETLKEVIRRTIAKFKNQFETEASPIPELKEPPPPPTEVFAPPPAAAAPAAAMPPSAVPPEIAAAERMASAAFDEFALDDLTDKEVSEVSLDGGDAEEILLEEEAGTPFTEAALESPREILLDEEVREEGVERALDLDERRRTFFEEVALEDFGVPEPAPGEGETSRPAAVPPPAEPELRGNHEETRPVDAEPPAWARDIVEELQQLRAENRGLREAIQGFVGVIDRQIAWLSEGREELARGLRTTGDELGESSRKT